MKQPLLVLLLLCGCSSIIEGRSQEIVINTNPAGANCTLLRNGSPIGTVSPTPSAVLIEKTKYDILIKCNKDGFQEATYMNKSGAAEATFGNIVLGGGIGWAIDSATGSDNKYDSPINLSLVPLYASSAPPASSASASAATPATDSTTQAAAPPAVTAPPPVTDSAPQVAAAPASEEAAETAEAPGPTGSAVPTPRR